MTGKERDRLIVNYQGLVKRIAFNLFKSIPPSEFSYEDLVGWGNIGLCEAVDSYDDDRGSFAAWAYLRIRGAMIDGMRAMDMFPRQIYCVRRDHMKAQEGLCASLGRHPTHDEIAESLDIPLQEYHAWRRKISQMEKTTTAENDDVLQMLSNVNARTSDISQWETNQDIVRAVKLLRPRERLVVYYTFWVGLTQSEIADIMGVQPTRVHQIKQDAIRALREWLVNYGETDGED